MKGGRCWKYDFHQALLPNDPPKQDLHVRLEMSLCLTWTVKISTLLYVPTPDIPESVEKCLAANVNPSELGVFQHGSPKGIRKESLEAWKWATRCNVYYAYDLSSRNKNKLNKFQLERLLFRKHKLVIVISSPFTGSIHILFDSSLPVHCSAHPSDARNHDGHQKQFGTPSLISQNLKASQGFEEKKGKNQQKLDKTARTA